MHPAAKPVQVSRPLLSAWGPRGRHVFEDILENVPPGLDGMTLHLVVIDPRRRHAMWAASRNAPHEVVAPTSDVVCPEVLKEGSARDVPSLHPVLAPLGAIDSLHLIPLGRRRRSVGLLVAQAPPRAQLAALRRHARVSAAALTLLLEVVVDQRELEGYRALSHLLDVGAPHDRRALAQALGRSMTAVTRARMCLILARADASQPLGLIGSRGYNSRKAQSLLMWPEEEPWASALNQDTVFEIATDDMDESWQEVLGTGRVLLVPVRWQGWVRSVLMFPADAGKTGGTHLVDPAQLGSVGAHAGLLYQNAELIQRLRRDEEVLRGLMQRAIQVQEEERRRIASDIHDGVTQRIVGIWYRLLALEKLLGRQGDGVTEALATIKEQVDITMQEARAAIYNLRPSTLDDLGLIPSLRSLAHEFRGETGVEVELEVRGERRLPDYVEVGIYRIAQEALRNVKKHAHATAARLTLQMDDGKVRLTVHDNGRGFQRKKRSGQQLQSFGLESMEERAQMLGAQLFVRTNPGEGTSIRVSIPIPTL